MMRLVANRIIIAFALVFLLFDGAIASRDRAFFWELKTEKATVYLLGSIHFANKSFYPLREPIERAYASAEHLAVELDMSVVDPAQYQAIINNTGTYKNNETIKDHVSKQTYQELERYLARSNIPLQAVEKFKPGVIVLMLTAAEATRLGYMPETGIDMHFIKKAHGHKNIISLETLEQQMAALLNVEDGNLLLEEQFVNMQDSEKMMRNMVDLWKRGDEQGMHKLLFDDALKQYPSFAKLYDGLFYQRNDRMVEKIQSFIKKGGSYFVVVGAGHLIGDKGIVSLLQQAGYELKRL